ncbi:uncharacterized protein LOC134718174 [Mytilus trossulus]|uniref:uncharacterized protein LOC134718174 n=1 Tax=Mytilus trossulus TaxID=6551 RepID=UPI0030079D93
MEHTYPEVLSTWELITMEMDTLRLELKWKKKEKQLCSESRIKFLELEIRTLQKQIERVSDRERNAQICLSKEVFSDASTEMIWHHNTRKMAGLQCLLDQSEKKAALTKDLPVLSLNEEKQTKEHIEENIKDLKKRLEKELKEIRVFESMLSKLNQSIFNEVENKSRPYEYKNEEPLDQSTQSINERENIRKSSNVNDTELDNDEKELNVEKLKNKNLSEVDGNLEDNQSKYENFNTADESAKVIDNNEEAHQADGRSHKDNDPAFQLLHNEGIITEKKNDNDTENVFALKEKFQNEYGIIIESMSQTNLSYDVEVWDSDERLKVVESKVFPDGFKLDTDIFYIKESTAGNSHGNEKRVVNDVLLKVLRPMEYNSYYEYKGAVKFGNAWRLIDCICQDMYMVFKVKEVESFCVLSFVRQEKSTVLSTGSQFISEIDNRIQVTFPPNAVSKEEQLSFKIHPVITNFILERITDSPNEEVYAITSGLSTVHMEFKKMFKVQLPLFIISDLCHEPEYINYKILKWNDNGLFQVTDIQPVISNGLVCFETNSFSGYGCVGTTRPQISSSLEYFVPEIYGFRKWCKILFFVVSSNG